MMASEYDTERPPMNPVVPNDIQVAVRDLRYKLLRRVVSRAREIFAPKNKDDNQEWINKYFADVEILILSKLHESMLANTTGKSLGSDSGTSSALQQLHRDGAPEGPKVKTSKSSNTAEKNKRPKQPKQPSVGSLRFEYDKTLRRLLQRLDADRVKENIRANWTAEELANRVLSDSWAYDEQLDAKGQQRDTARTRTAGADISMTAQHVTTNEHQNHKRTRSSSSFITHDNMGFPATSPKRIKGMEAEPGEIVEDGYSTEYDILADTDWGDDDKSVGRNDKDEGRPSSVSYGASSPLSKSSSYGPTVPHNSHASPSGPTQRLKDTPSTPSRTLEFKDWSGRVIVDFDLANGVQIGVYAKGKAGKFRHNSLYSVLTSTASFKGRISYDTVEQHIALCLRNPRRDVFVLELSVNDSDSKEEFAKLLWMLTSREKYLVYTPPKHQQETPIKDCYLFGYAHQDPIGKIPSWFRDLGFLPDHTGIFMVLITTPPEVFAQQMRRAVHDRRRSDSGASLRSTIDWRMQADAPAAYHPTTQTYGAPSGYHPTLQHNSSYSSTAISYVPSTYPTSPPVPTSLPSRVPFIPEPELQVYISISPQVLTEDLFRCLLNRTTLFAQLLFVRPELEFQPNLSRMIMGVSGSPQWGAIQAMLKGFRSVGVPMDLNSTSSSQYSINQSQPAPSRSSFYEPSAPHHSHASSMTKYSPITSSSSSQAHMVSKPPLGYPAYSPTTSRVSDRYSSRTTVDEFEPPKPLTYRNEAPNDPYERRRQDSDAWNVPPSRSGVVDRPAGFGSSAPSDTRRSRSPPPTRIKSDMFSGRMYSDLYDTADHTHDSGRTIRGRSPSPRRVEHPHAMNSAYPYDERGSQRSRSRSPRSKRYSDYGYQEKTSADAYISRNGPDVRDDYRGRRNEDVKDSFGRRDSQDVKGSYDGDSYGSRDQRNAYGRDLEDDRDRMTRGWRTRSPSPRPKYRDELNEDRKSNQSDSRNNWGWSTSNSRDANDSSGNRGERKSYGGGYASGHGQTTSQWPSRDRSRSPSPSTNENRRSSKADSRNNWGWSTSNSADANDSSVNRGERKSHGGGYTSGYGQNASQGPSRGRSRSPSPSTKYNNDKSDDKREEPSVKRDKWGWSVPDSEDTTGNSWNRNESKSRDGGYSGGYGDKDDTYGTKGYSGGNTPRDKTDNAADKQNDDREPASVYDENKTAELSGDRAGSTTGGANASNKYGWVYH